MSSTVIATVTVGGEKVEIKVDSLGMFWAEYDEDAIKDPTLLGLKEKLAKLDRRTQDAHPIPVSVINLTSIDPKILSRGYGRPEPFERGIGVVPAKLRGRNRHTRELMMITDDGQKFTLSSYDSKGIVCRPLSFAEVTEYIRLARAVEDARERLEVWTAERRVNMDELLAGRE